MPEVEVRFQSDAHFDQKRPLHGQLQRPTGHHADGQSDNRFGEKRMEQKGGNDHADVQDDRRQGRCGKMPERIEDAHAKGNQRNKEDVGKHDPVQKNGQLELIGQVGETGGHDPDDQR